MILEQIFDSMAKHSDSLIAYCIVMFIGVIYLGITVCKQNDQRNEEDRLGK